MNKFIKVNNIKKGVRYVVIGPSIALALNYLFIAQILIPDPCYYHINNTTKLFDLFHNFPSYTGGHPVPSIFNFVFTGVLGGIIGFKIYQKMLVS